MQDHRAAPGPAPSTVGRVLLARPHPNLVETMQDWLRANGQTAPDTSSYHTMIMPGMLTSAQIKSLDAARGAEFDRQFLTLMIQHHEGALRMVEELLASPLAAQDVDVSVFANDVTTVQTAEIALMLQMLANL